MLCALLDKYKKNICLKSEQLDPVQKEEGILFLPIVSI